VVRDGVGVQLNQTQRDASI